MKYFATDRVTGVVLLIFGAWFANESRQLTSTMRTDPLGPSTFPMLLGFALMILSLYLIARPGADVAWPEASGWLKMGLILLSFVVYAYIMEPLGYIIATSLEMIALSLIFRGPVLKSIAASVTFSVLMFALFTMVLDLRLPPGDIFMGGNG